MNSPFCDDEHHVRVRLLVILVESPDEMRCADQPSDVDNDDVAQREGDEDCGLNGVVPILERRIDWQQNKQHEIENPVESESRGSSAYFWFMCKCQ